MVRKFRVGNVLQTGAVVTDIPVVMSEIPYFSKGEKNQFKLTMVDEDAVYGLGEQVRGINKRGFIYESNCADDCLHTEGKRSLYGAHNFFVFDGKEQFGMFIDCPGVVSFDIGYTKRSEFVITITDEDYDIYVITGESILDIVKQFREIIGRSYIAPKWGLGYGQSRWSYATEAEVMEVVDSFKKNNIPLDSVYLDIDYMERYKDFTVDLERYPDLKGLSDKLKKEGIRLVPIIDAGVKIEDGYNVYEEGVKNNYFCKDKDGKDYVVGVWPGKVHLPDMLNREAREWFGNHYKYLLDMGIEGFWNDMNEPALFYSQAGLDEAFAEIKKLENTNLDIHSYFHMKDVINGLANNPKDYASFYHNIEGEMVCHSRVHNLYGYNMTKAAGEAFERLEPDKRILMFSRSSYIGMHRYGGIWMGDNQSWWSHILLNLKMLPSLNMCGFLYTGADLGGFGDQATEDLVMRWLELGIFTPLMRNHSAAGTKRQEPYQFENVKAFADILGIRYALLPYIYSEYMKASLRDEMMFMPLSFVFTEDKKAKNIEDQMLIGDTVMIAPIYTQNATGRYVYLPEDMMCVRMKSATEYLVEEMKAGDHYVDVALEEVVFFIRNQKRIPMGKASDCVDHMEKDVNALTMIGYADGDQYELYTDDGFTKDYEDKNNIVML